MIAQVQDALLKLKETRDNLKVARATWVSWENREEYDREIKKCEKAISILEESGDFYKE
jgi:hypothetical protein